MHIVVFSARSYDRSFFDAANADGRHLLTYLEARLDTTTAVAAKGADAVCVFVNDVVDAGCLRQLHALGVQLLLLRSAGFNHVDLAAAASLGITVARVPEYSPHAVAEHTVALILTLNRKTHRAHARVREGNFALEGLLGFDLNARTVGIIGTGRIGSVFARIMVAFGSRVLACDPEPDPRLRELGVQYLTIRELLSASDVVSIHCPLNPSTRHLINADALALMKSGAMLVNTSRGAVIDTRAVIAALKRGHLGGLALDVYEEEGDLFFRDLSGDVLQDDVFARLLTFPNVLITGHQGFFTHEAMTAIARTTLDNADAFVRDGRPRHPVSVEHVI